MDIEISGELSGIRASQLQELKDLGKLKTERSELIHPEILDRLLKLTYLWKREIAVYLSRTGILMAATVGNQATVNLPPLKGRSAGKLRCVHTHPNGGFRLSSLDRSALAVLELESMAAVGVREGLLTGIQVAFRTGEDDPVTVNLSPQNWQAFAYADFLSNLSSLKKTARKSEAVEDKERACLVGLVESAQDALEDLVELGELARTAGAEVVGRVAQFRRSGGSRSYLGSGKMDELVHILQDTGANVVICDDELSPNQLRALETKTGRKVLDRTTLILDIFAQRARSREGKLQVELAQLKHLLPYLTGQGQALSRLGAGIGSRGPGESKLELDRRRMRERITQLERELKQVLDHRVVQRRQRTRSGLLTVALVGYTNAGKTTFMQAAMEQSGNHSDLPQGENMLFATLDPLVRRIKVSPSLGFLLSDTVGFIRKLPTQLLRAFLATLEEVRQADLLIHVVDASHPQALQQAETVHEVLAQLECQGKPVLTLLNKIDKVSREEDFTELEESLPHPLKLSLTRGDSLKPVWRELEQLRLELG